jgi:hypothetical protein
MPYKSKEQQKQANRDARRRERLELKQLRITVKKALELIRCAPIPGDQALKELEIILSDTVTPTPKLSSYWQQQRELSKKADKKDGEQK